VFLNIIHGDSLVWVNFEHFVEQVVQDWRDEDVIVCKQDVMFTLNTVLDELWNSSWVVLRAHVLQPDQPAIGNAC